MITNNEYLMLVELKKELKYFEELYDLLMPGGAIQAFLNICSYHNNLDADSLKPSKANPKLLNNRGLFEYKPSLLEEQNELFIIAVESRLFELENQIRKYIKE